MNTNNSILQRIKQGIADMCYIWEKEIRSIFSDEGVLLFCIIVPLLYPLLYSWAYSNEVVHNIPLAIVDQSKTNLSRKFVRMIDASPHTNATYYCNNLDEAKELVKQQIVNGVIYLPSSFDLDIKRNQQTHVSIYCDMSLMFAYKAILEATNAVTLQLNKQIQQSKQPNFTQRDDEIALQPLAVEEVPIFNSTGGYGNAIIPGVLMLIIQQTLLLGIGLAAGTARENNRYQDLVPMSKHYNGIFRIVLGKSMAYFMLYAVLAAYLTLIVPRIFNFTTLSHSTALVGLLVPYLLASIFFGMALSGIVRYRENVILLVVFTSVPLLFLTGVSWPQHNIPGFWKGVSWLFPSTFGVSGYIRINTMGATLLDIKTEYQVLWLQVLAYFMITCLVYRYQIMRTHKIAIEQMQQLRLKARLAREKKLQEPFS